MGWFWQSPPRSPAEGKPAPQAKTKQPKEEQPETDPEIIKFLELFQAELRGTNKPTEQQSGAESQPSAAPSSTQPASPPAQSTAPSSSWFSSWRSTPSSSSPPSHPPSADPIARQSASEPSSQTSEEASSSDIRTATLPSTMSCRDAFDRAFHCNGLGGQWNNVYRYGTVRACSEQWDDFWFCMRTRSYSTERRAEAIRERFREREFQKYYAPGKRSSEDVWEGRERRVEPGTAFVADAEVVNESDAEWRARDAERRQKLREEMGY